MGVRLEIDGFSTTPMDELSDLTYSIPYEQNVFPTHPFSQAASNFSFKEREELIIAADE
jgi:hypothetical protein